MSDLKKVLREAYAAKEAEEATLEKVGSDQLIGLIEEVMRELETQQLNEDEMTPSMKAALDKPDPDADDDEQIYYLPTIKITEAWGQPGTKDRQIIEKFTKRIAGDSLEQKIASLNRVITEVDPNAGIPDTR